MGIDLLNDCEFEGAGWGSEKTSEVCEMGKFNIEKEYYAQNDYTEFFQYAAWAGNYSE